MADWIFSSYIQNNLAKSSKVQRYLLIVPRTRLSLLSSIFIYSHFNTFAFQLQFQKTELIFSKKNMCSKGLNIKCLFQSCITHDNVGSQFNFKISVKLNHISSALFPVHLTSGTILKRSSKKNNCKMQRRKYIKYLFLHCNGSLCSH